MDCFQVQEHFKAIKTIEQFFKTNFTKYESYVSKAVREDLNHAGRPKGGLAQLVCKSSKIKEERIASQNWRIQAQMLHINGFKLLWVNVYFPTDPQTQRIDETELNATLKDLENIIETSKVNNIIVGGDWNYDDSRTSRFCRIVNDFLEKHELVSVWDKFGADYTYQHNNLTSFSTIDHFFVNQHFLENCVDAAPIHLVDNRSNHSPIMIKVKIPEVIERSNLKPQVTTKPDWRKASDEDKDNFTAELHEKLSDLEMPDSLFCTDVTCENPEHS